MIGRRDSRHRGGLPLLIAAILVVIAALSIASFFVADHPLTLSVALLNAGLAGLVLWVAWYVRRDWQRAHLRDEWLVTTLRSIGDGVIATDAAGRITLMNGVAQELTGWREDEALQKPLVKVFQPLLRQSRQPAESPVDKVIREGRNTAFIEPVLLVARDGAERFITGSAAPIRNNKGVSGVVFIVRDVTEHELAESALRASQEMLRSITDHISDFISVVDLEGHRLYASKSFERVLQLPGELYHRSSFDDIHPEDRSRVEALFHETVRTGVGQRTEYRMIGREGGVLELESAGSVIRNSSGQVDKVVIVSRDISDRRQAAERVRREKEFSDTLINSMPGIFYLYDARRKILRWNKNLETVTGYSSEEFDSLDPLTYFPEEEKPLVHERMLKCFAEGSTDIEVNLLSKTGGRTPYYVTGYRLDIEGRPCMLGIGIDLTARLSAEKALHATMHRLRRQKTALAGQARQAESRGNLAQSLRHVTELAADTLEVGRVSVWFYNADRTRIRCVDLFAQKTGGHTADQELSASEYPEYFRALADERSIAVQDAVVDPRTREFADGYLRPNGIASMLDAPIRSGGRMVGIICHEHVGSPRAWTPDEQSFAGSMADLVSLSLEVAQRRDAESALREAHASLEHKVVERTRALAEANGRLQELDRLKSEFLATMSHELRTPLNSIIGFTGILRQELPGPLNDEQKKQLGMVHASARHLLGLINDLLDLSRIESGKMRVIPETFHVDDLILEIAQSLAPMVEQKQLRLETSMDQPDLILHTDRKRCFQVLLNLANNAVKFTDTGLIRLATRTNSEHVEFSVSDTGIGIKPENMPHLFEAFRQVDGSARRVYEGTGLGLYLSRKLATLLGGELTAESEFGIGSRFTFIVPRTALEPPVS